MIDGAFTGPAQPQAGQRHSYLGDRQQPRRIRKQIERRLRSHLSFRRHGAQPALAHRDQRHFRGGEKSVQSQNRNENNETVGHQLSSPAL